MAESYDNVEFVPHCDDGSCDLGAVYYFCPLCRRRGTDYDEAWFRRGEMWDGTAVAFSCEHCRGDLLLTYKNGSCTVSSA